MPIETNLTTSFNYDNNGESHKNGSTSATPSHTNSESSCSEEELQMSEEQQECQYCQELNGDGENHTSAIRLSSIFNWNRNCLE